MVLQVSQERYKTDPILLSTKMNMYRKHIRLHFHFLRTLTVQMAIFPKMVIHPCHILGHNLENVLTFL